MKKIFLIVFILLLSGCYNYRELNNIDIISSVGIDKKTINIMLAYKFLTESKVKILKIHKS